jgi:pimeloyl-ACP methyl ester carboxylesterase
MACNYTERTFNLPDGTEYSYNDGGPVPGSIDYTTLVTIHGSGFNGASFVHMHEYAHQRNLRLINVNRRGYRGSTKFSDTDLDDFGGGRQVYHHKLALQLSQFLEHLVLVENIPPPDMNRKSGGIVFLGWSFGNATSMMSTPCRLRPPNLNLMVKFTLSYQIQMPFQGPFTRQSNLIF